MSSCLIGIAGPSCSGKSEVARRLGRILRAPILALDHYYRDLKHIPFEERVKTNFDAPEALDSELILAHALRLKEGHAVEQPTYDFAQHVRASGVERILPAPFVILEGLFALYWPELRRLLECKVYISASHDVCLARRIDRDVRERGRTEDSVRAQYEATVRPMCERYVEPTREYADLVLSGTDPVKQSVLAVLRRLR
jgi:uridine kinase